MQASLPLDGICTSADPTPVVGASHASGPALRLAVIIAILGLSAALPAEAQIAFDEVTTSAGFRHVGASWGSAWGDYNGDGRPDLWVGNHNHGAPSLYRNRGDGTFEDVTASVVVGRRTGDRHGPAWADFDNDGDQDLISVEGNSLGFDGPPNQFYVNAGGVLTDEASARGVVYPDPNPFSSIGGNTTPLWFDYDNDGRLDLLISTLAPGIPSVLLGQRGGAFVNESEIAGFTLHGASAYAQITGAGTTGLPLLLNHSYAYPDHAYRYDVLPFEDVTMPVGLHARQQTVFDTAIADFNGDTLPDLFEVRHAAASDLIPTPNGARVTLQPNGNEIGFSFRTSALTLMRVGPPNFMLPTDMHLGHNGVTPTAIPYPTPAPDELTQTSWIVPLRSDDPRAPGIAAHTPGVDFGLFVGRDGSQPPKWTVLVSRANFFTVNIEIIGTGAVSEITPIGFEPSTGAQTPLMKIRLPQGYAAVPAAGALSVPMPCESVAAGDFDNDMDVDLYLVCNRRAGNVPNVLLENAGNGGFRPVLNAGGAAGSNRGRGDVATVADYDADGFLDLFVTNGAGDAFFNEGPDQLFHNRGNGNHWVEIDLQGTVKNRDAIGARVLLVAGGTVQMREVTGGIHRSAQDSKRLHFGLGANIVVDALRIEWPGGQVQELPGIPVDQVTRITEPVPQ